MSTLPVSQTTRSQNTTTRASLFFPVLFGDSFLDPNGHGSMEVSDMKAYLVCAGTNGRAVIYGKSEKPPEVGKPFSLENARMVLYWSRECGGLFGLASDGPKVGCRLTSSVTHHADVEAKQVLGVPDATAAVFDAFEVYRG